MAKLRYGTVVTDARGSVEGTTFSDGPFGAFARARKPPRLQQTAFSTPVRATLSTFSKRWSSTLTQVQRDAWIALAVANPVTDVFGNAHALSGHQLFIRANQLLIQAGVATIDAAPPDQALTGITSTSIIATAPATLTITFAPTPLAAGHRLYISATPNLSPGKIPDKAAMRFIGVSALAQASAFAAGGLYTTRLAPLITARRISVAVQVFRDSRAFASTPIIATDII